VWSLGGICKYIFSIPYLVVFFIKTKTYQPPPTYQGEVTEGYGPIVEFLLSEETEETLRESSLSSISQMKLPRIEAGPLP
jgi:hypothetical protein